MARSSKAYQCQLTRLEDSVNETRQGLVQVNKEKSESVLKLQNLDREMMGLHELRSTGEHGRPAEGESLSRCQMLQEHLEALEREKHALAQKMEQLLALLDHESLKGDVSFQKQPRNIYSKDAAFSPWGVKDNYQLSPSPMTTSSPLVRSMTGKTNPSVITATPIRYQKYVPRREQVEISKEKADDNKMYQKSELSPYPKVLKDGAIENFRPQEVNEKVTYAEPLSPPDEQDKILNLEKTGDDWNDTVDQPFEKKQESNFKMKAALDEASLQLVEPALTSFFIKSEAMEKQIEKEEAEKPHSPIDAWIEEEIVGKSEQPIVESSHSYKVESSPNIEEPSETSAELVEEVFTEKLCNIAVKSQKETAFANKEIEKLPEQNEAWIEKESSEDTKAVQQVESSDSETEAFVEPNFDTKSSSPVSEREVSFHNQPGDNVMEDFTFDSVRASMDDISPAREKLYPDGEEMDTWDSVMERNQGLKADDLEEQTQEVLKQHAEPEEDISAKEVHQPKQEIINEEEMQAKTEPQIHSEEQNDSMKEDVEDKSEDDEQESSQNVSVSWRTELEGDSYAQDNTLADTRPLIRYKSDETDANTQASHVDDVYDSSDGEQDRKVGEMGSSAWIDDQTRRFGTMEDLCEEAEGGELDEEYDLEYLRKDAKEDKEEMDSQEDEEKIQQEIIKTVEEELDTDKLVEQELENLTTEWYTTHFAHQQTSAKEVVAEQPIAWGEALEGMQEINDNGDYFTSEALVQKSDDHFDISQQQEDAEDKDAQDVKAEEEKHEVKAEEEKHEISMVTKEYVLSSTSQDLSFDNVSIEPKEQAEEKQSDLTFNTTTETNKPCSTNQEVSPYYDVKMGDTAPEEIFVAEEEITETKNQTENDDHDATGTEINKSSSNIQEVTPDNSFEMKNTTPEEIVEFEETKTESFCKGEVTTEVKILKNPTEIVHHDAFGIEISNASLAVQEVASDDVVEMRVTPPEEIVMPEELDTEFSKVRETTEWEVAKNLTENVYDDAFGIEVSNASSSNQEVAPNNCVAMRETPAEEIDTEFSKVLETTEWEVAPNSSENVRDETFGIEVSHTSSIIQEVIPDNVVEMRETLPEEIILSEDSKFTEAQPTTEWEVLKNPTENVHHDAFETETNKVSGPVQEVSLGNSDEMKDTASEEITVPEHVDTELHKVQETTEWEVLENPTENVHHDDKIDFTPKCISTDDKVEHDSLSPRDDPINMSPESVHEGNDLFFVKDSNELLKTNGKANLDDDMFNLNANNDSGCPHWKQVPHSNLMTISRQSGS
ncbi:hypothetical protein WMY93_026578 [Mugilogobius chulae]|uniref:Uncharacterized protein n=1 Tax=Mugilogobius chulae TaxID=88201 RepID=A0AAW0N4P0_9GOBI